MDITVYVTSLLTSSERRISSQWSLEHLKQKLLPITGIEPRYQQLFLYPISHSNERIELKSNDESMTILEQFQIKELMRIHVKDMDPNSQLSGLEANEDNITDTKYKFTKESYEQRSDSVMNWKRQNQLGRFDPNFEKKRQEQMIELNAKLPTLKIGQRCKIANETRRRIGVIRYIGKVPEIDNKGDSIWCGIEFDEPMGKNDGSIKGQRYFQCGQNYGSFINPLLVETGDFPVEDPDDLMMSSSGDEI